MESFLTNFIYCFILTFIISMYPFGYIFYIRICRNRVYEDMSKCQAFFSYIILLIVFISYYMYLLYQNDCQPGCVVFFFSQSIFQACCKFK